MPEKFFSQAILLTLLLISLGSANSITAAPGDVDLSFDAGAILFNGTPGQVEAVATLPNGKVLIGGRFTSVGGVSRTFLARLNTDGSVDTGFNAMLSGFGIGNDLGVVNTIAVQADGKILIGGGFQLGADIEVVARLNENGSLDATFSSDGGGSFARKIVLQPDGKIIVAGQLGNFGGMQSRGIVRLNPNGTLDVSLGLVANLQNNIYAVALQADGKIIVGGNTFVGGTMPVQNHIARLHPNGMLDTTFAVGSGADNAVYALAVQPDGKILAGGFFTSINGASRTAIARLNPDGMVDPGFAPTIIGNNSVFSILLQANGKILVGGGLGVISGQVRSGLARFNADGSLDSFYPSGGAINNLVRDIAYQPCSKILIGGDFTLLGGVARSRLARLVDAPRKSVADFDGDGCTDLSVFRPSDGTWHINRSTAGFTAQAFGISTDKLAPADYDGDGKTDIAVWRESAFAYLYILQSSTNTFRFEQFGQTGDVLTAGDWDGDGRADASVYRDSAVGSQSYFYYRGTLNNPGGTITFVPFGTTGDKPVRGDFDGDGKTDAAIFRPSNGVWYIRRSSDGALQALVHGLNNDRLLPADYDGDGNTDTAVWRPTDGHWYVRRSASGASSAFNWGAVSDVLTPGDYDGDGQTDYAVYRGGVWYIRQTANGFRTEAFGAGGDVPVPSTYLP